LDDLEYRGLENDAARKILAIEAVDVWRSIGAALSLLMANGQNTFVSLRLTPT